MQVTIELFGNRTYRSKLFYYFSLLISFSIKKCSVTISVFHIHRYPVLKKNLYDTGEIIVEGKTQSGVTGFAFGINAGTMLV